MSSLDAKEKARHTLHFVNIGLTMARAAKRSNIIVASANLFLAEGFKGTTIDLVCQTCEVSKPTVYKYFPDKSVLFAEIMIHWLSQHSVVAAHATQWPDLRAHLSTHWWAPEPMAMYRLVLAEGWRFKASANAFWQQFDQAWWQYIEHWVAQNATQHPIQQWIRAELWQAIMPPAQRPAGPLAHPL